MWFWMFHHWVALFQIWENLSISPSSLRIKFSHLVCINGQFWSISWVCDYIQSLTCVKTIPSCSVLDWKEAYFRPWRFVFKLNIQCLSKFVFGLLTLHCLAKINGLEWIVVAFFVFPFFIFIDATKSSLSSCFMAWRNLKTSFVLTSVRYEKMCISFNVLAKCSFPSSDRRDASDRMKFELAWTFWQRNLNHNRYDSE